MSNSKRIVVVEKELVVTGFGGSFRRPLEERPSGWWRRLLTRAQRLLRRGTGRAQERRIVQVR